MPQRTIFEFVPDANQFTNDDPDLSGVSGDGEPRSGPGSLGGGTGPPLATINVSEFDIYQTKRKSLFFEGNVSICEPTRLRVSSVESVTKQPNQKLQQTKSLALAHLVIDGGAG
jgi:hypothetical protein